MYVLLSHHDDLVYLNDFLSSRFIQDLHDPKDHSYVITHFSSIYKLFYSLTTAVGFTFITAFLTMLISLKNGKYLYMMPAKYPINIEPCGLTNRIIVTLEFIAGVYLWAITSGFDGLFGMYTLQITGQFKVLAKRFESLGESIDYKKDLKQCIKSHHLLMKSRDALERIFGFFTIWMTITSAFIQCTVAFQILIELKTMSFSKIGYFCFYITLKLVQTFSYAWYGNLIVEESALCLNAMYNAHWAGSGNSRFMSDVLVVLSQRPLIFRAKGCMSLRMEIFTKVLNTSVSYFFLLQTIDEGVK